MAPPIAVFGGWTGGEFGSLGPYAAPPGSFHANNMLRYLDGTLGPRPGLKKLAVTGLSPMVVTGIGSVSDVGGSGAPRILYTTPTNGVGPALRGFTYPAGADSLLGTISGVSNRTQIVTYGTAAFIASPADGLYQWLEAAGTFTALSAGPAGAISAAYYRGFLLAAQDLIGGANPNRVRFSSFGNAGVWPALNVFDVGLSNLSFLGEIRGRLAIATMADEWWLLSGTPGVNDTLVRAPRGDLSPTNPQCVARAGESLWFLPNDDDFPVEFTTALTNPQFRHLRFAGAGDASTRSAASLIGNSGVMFGDATSKRALVLHNGVWTFHTLGIVPSFLTPLAQGGLGSSNPLIVCDSSVFGSPAFYQWAPYLDRPGKVSDTVAQPGDGTTTPLDAGFETPAFHTYYGRAGSRIEPGRVLEITVDFNKYNTGALTSNHFDIKARALYTRDNQSLDSDEQTFDEAPSKVHADGERACRVFHFNTPLADVYQVVVENVRGVSIASMKVGFNQ